MSWPIRWSKAPDAQQAVWFLGALVRIRIGGDATSGRLAVLEHQEQRGHASPLHRHDAADETFLVLEGELRVQVDGEMYAAGAGSTAFLPRRRPHAFAVTRPRRGSSRSTRRRVLRTSPSRPEHSPTMLRPWTHRSTTRP